jgi:hypothetical protein
MILYPNKHSDLAAEREEHSSRYAQLLQIPINACAPLGVRDDGACAAIDAALERCQFLEALRIGHGRRVYPETQYCGLCDSMRLA